MKRRNDAIISAVVGAIIQVILSYVLTNWAQFSVGIAIGAAFPVSFIVFIVFWYLITRYRGKSDNIAPPYNSGATQPAKVKNELMEVLKKVGIIDCTHSLSKSKYEPMECMKLTRRSLSFMGILGSKWVTEAHILNEFKRLLKRAQEQNGLIRFLLINPQGEHFNRLNSLREGAISTESLKRFQELMNEFPCLQVNLYNMMPCFRLVFIDGKIVALSRYKIDKEGYFQSRFGWDAPHLVIDAGADWSLYDAFELYYEQMWKASVDLKSILTDGRA